MNDCKHHFEKKNWEKNLKKYFESFGIFFIIIIFLVIAIGRGNYH